jgi:hypothetical protein
MNIAHPNASDVIHEQLIRRGGKNISRSLTKKNGKSIVSFERIEQKSRPVTGGVAPGKIKPGPWR